MEASQPLDEGASPLLFPADVLATAMQARPPADGSEGDCRKRADADEPCLKRA